MILWATFKCQTPKVWLSKANMLPYFPQECSLVILWHPHLGKLFYYNYYYYFISLLEKSTYIISRYSVFYIHVHTYIHPYSTHTQSKNSAEVSFERGRAVWYLSWEYVINNYWDYCLICTLVHQSAVCCMLYAVCTIHACIKIRYVL